MNVLLIILPFALVISGIFLSMFIMSIKKGQFDDLDTPANNMLLDDKVNINKELK